MDNNIILKKIMKQKFRILIIKNLQKKKKRNFMNNKIVKLACKMEILTNKKMEMEI